MVYLGIDPGVSGGLALIDDHRQVLAVHRMPRELGVLVEVLRTIHEQRAVSRPHGPIPVGIEKVGASPQMGVVSAFTFGRNVGELYGALLAIGYVVYPVAPLRWQNALGCRTGGDKHITQARAQALFPGVRPVTHAIADALLIAEYTRRTLE